MGDELPRVSQILKLAGVLPDSTYLPQSALDRGTAVHLYTELYDRGRLDESQVDPIVAPYLEGYKNFLLETGAEVIGIEEKVESRIYQYQGRLDRRLKIGKDFLVMDIKCGQPMPWHALQLAAYSLTLPPEYSRFRLGVCLDQSYPRGYKLAKYKERSDYDIWKACLTLFHWKSQVGFEDQLLEAASVRFGGETELDPWRFQ